MSKAYLFYANQLVDTFDSPNLSRHVRETHGQEVYNGAYLYAPWDSRSPYEWWRCDITPVPLAHVPKELRALQLLLAI